MTRLIEILISLAIVAVLFVAVGFLLPSSRHIENSVETNRKLTVVYDTISSFRRFDDWNTLALRDPGMDQKLVGPGLGGLFQPEGTAAFGTKLPNGKDVTEENVHEWILKVAVAIFAVANHAAPSGVPPPRERPTGFIDQAGTYIASDAICR